MGGSLNKSSVTVEEVEGSGVGELWDDKGTLKTSGFSTNAVLRGFRVGGINVIIMGVAGAVEQRLEISRERHMGGEVGGGKREKGEEKNEQGESLIKRVINRRGTLNPETFGNGMSSISNNGSHPYLRSSIPLWVD